MDLQARANKLAHLLEERLGIQGHGLEAKLAHAGRRLPRYVRREAGYLAQALRMEDSPRLAPQIDWARVEKGCALVERYLKGIDGWERRLGLELDWLAGNAISLLVVAGLAAAALAWRGFV